MLPGLLQATVPTALSSVPLVGNVAEVEVKKIAEAGPPSERAKMQTRARILSFISIPGHTPKHVPLSISGVVLGGDVVVLADRAGYCARCHLSSETELGPECQGLSAGCVLQNIPRNFLAIFSIGRVG